MIITQYCIKIDGKTFKNPNNKDLIQRAVDKLYASAKKEHPEAVISDAGFLPCKGEDYWEICVNACETGPNSQTSRFCDKNEEPE